MRYLVGNEKRYVVQFSNLTNILQLLLSTLFSVINKQTIEQEEMNNSLLDFKVIKKNSGKQIVILNY